MFDTNADPYLIGAYTGGELFFFAQLFVGSRSGVDHQGLCVSYIGEVAGEFQGVDESGSAFFSAFDAEVQDAALTVIKICFCETVIGIAL